MTARSIKLRKNKIIPNRKGDIIKFINKNSKDFSRFGEIYFSEVKKNKTKGWNIHYRYQCILAVPFGEIDFSFFNSTSKKKNIRKIVISKKNNYSIVVPPGTWFSFKSNVKLSIVTNLLSGIHDNKESDKSNIINGIKITK
jgi:dTDP-4-dehydrorhamnose 3,5-epimerase